MRYRDLMTETTTPAPETPWHEITTGTPAMFYAWRGEYGSTTPLSQRWQAKLGRRYLLGDGFYAAPTKLMSKRFGEPLQCRITLYNPFVFVYATAATFEDFDLDACRAQHDGIVIREGRAVGNEDLRQVCVFPDHIGQVERDIAPPKLTTLQPNARVRIKSDWKNDYARETYGHLSGLEGKVTSIVLGHPNVRIKGKTYLLSRDDVEVI